MLSIILMTSVLIADVNAAADCMSYLPLSWNLSPFLNHRTLTFSLFILPKSLQHVYTIIHPVKVQKLKCLQECMQCIYLLNIYDTLCNTCDNSDTCDSWRCESNLTCRCCQSRAKRRDGGWTWRLLCCSSNTDSWFLRLLLKMRERVIWEASTLTLTSS